MATELLEPAMSTIPTGGSPAAVSMPFDLSKGHPILAVPLGEHEAVATLGVRQLLAFVPDPRLSENRNRTAEDPLLAEYAQLRTEVQRAVSGAKSKNAVKYGQYIVEGLQGRRPYILPPITLFHPRRLDVTQLGHGLVALILPFGDFFVAIDGETQRIGWQHAANEYRDALDAVVKVIIHHGKSVTDARQGFYDLNTKEVKPNAAVAISMDSVDVATRITRKLMEASEVLKGRVNLQRRQLRASDTDVLTISALRTGIVTTILGTSGLQVGSRSVAIGSKAGELAPETDIDALEAAVVDVWSGILEQIEDELEPTRRPESVVWAPPILAGIGIVAHHAMPHPPRKDDTAEWTADEVLERLNGVIWERVVDATEPASVWSGIAGKFTPSGRFSIGGPKEFGRLVADALENHETDTGRRIRGAN